MWGTQLPRRSVALSAALAALLTACGTKESSGVPPAPILGVVAFDQTAAMAANDLLQRPEVGTVCGSKTATFGSELVNTAPQSAKVYFEWGAIGEDLAAEKHGLALARAAGATDVAWNGLREPKQVFVSGKVQDFQLSTGDLTFNHPFGLDMTMDVKPDPVYQAAALSLGEGSDSDGPPKGTIHIEIQQGLVPHSGPGLQDFLPGYEPANGDRIAAWGPWIIDCGHADFHTELHELTLLVFGHPEGSSTTVAHAFYNPYRQAQYLAARGDLTNDFGYWARWSDPSVKPFPPYLVAELLRVGHIKEPFHDQIEAHQMLKANVESPAPWYVCAPAGGSGTLTYSYSFSVRPGVSITADPDQSKGCVRFTASITDAYRPMTPERSDCVDPWDELNAQLQAALGDPTLDVRKLIEKQVPASFLPAVERDPVVDCYNPLQVPAPSGTGRSIVTSDAQPYPFYGEAKVGWKP